MAAILVILVAWFYLSVAGSRTVGDETNRTEPHGTCQNAEHQHLLDQLWRVPAWKQVRTISACPQQGKNVVYLTFDDGPAKNLFEFSALLEKLNVHATFFWTVGNIQLQKNDAVKTNSLEEYLKGMRHLEKQGHAAGSHTLWHQDLSKEDDAKMDSEIGTADQVLRDTLQKPVFMLRPPRGLINEKAKRYIQEHSLKYTVVMWDIDTLDWNPDASPGPEPVLQRIDNAWGKDGGKAGHIILMHEGKKGTGIEAITKVVEHIQKLCGDCSFESLSKCPEVARATEAEGGSFATKGSRDAGVIKPNFE